ncbi:MAG: alpha/beta fold hydrolase [Synechococcales cyanobacterium RM1_1_8]|nr:alpha/beta fold hydrolase [Synechococcales cyanobacterium RM1_1_8]
MRYLYLHGLASGPKSAKAKYLQARFRDRGLDLEMRDFNLDDTGEFNFASLTLSRKIAQTQAWIAQSPEPVILIGSSLGGLTAAWVAQNNPQVVRQVLLAPALDMAVVWLSALGRAELRRWRETGQRELFHYGLGEPRPLDYGFVTDLGSYDEGQLQRALPTLILHGQQDDVIPIQASQQFAASRHWVQLQALPGDHSLGSAVSTIWREIKSFCKLP